MKRWNRFLEASGAVVVAFLVQTIALLFLGMGRVAPDVMLATVMAFALTRSIGPVLGVSAVSGLLQDALANELLGINGFSKPLVAYGIVRARANLMLGRGFRVAPLLVAGSVLDAAVVLGLRILGGERYLDSGLLWPAVLGLPLTVLYGVGLPRLLVRIGKRPKPER